MRVVVKAVADGTIADFNDRPEFSLVTLSQDVESVKEMFGNRQAVKEFDGFLVKEEDGDYSEVYGFTGSVPYNNKTVYKVTRTFVESKSPKTKSRGKKRSRRTDTSRPSLGGMR